MEFPGESAVQEKTKVFDFGGFKDRFLIKVQGYSKVKGFVRRSENNELRFINI